MDFVKQLKQKIKRIDERQSIKASVKLYKLVKVKDGARRVVAWGLYREDALRLQRLFSEIKKANGFDDNGKVSFEMTETKIEEN